MSLSLGACTAPPAFRAALPEHIDIRGKSIAIIGDLQQTPGPIRFLRRREETSAAQQTLTDDLRARADQLAALVVVGDLVYTAQSPRDWQHFDTLMTGIADRIPILPAIGNHDYPCALVLMCRTGHMAEGMQSRFPWLAPGEPYAVDAGALVLLFIDSESRLDAQALWLQRRLNDAAGEFDAALVFFHRPPYSNSIEKTARGDMAVSETIVPVLRESPLPTVVFNGHIHGFEHLTIDSLPFITTGGGGGPRVAMPPGNGNDSGAGSGAGSSSDTKVISQNVADSHLPDAYDGPQCTLPKSNAIARPFNYVLLRHEAARLTIEVRGLCEPGDTVTVIHWAQFPL